MSFETGLKDLINTHSIENESDTPDFILARYMRACLDTFNVATKDRDSWLNKLEDELLPDD